VKGLGLDRIGGDYFLDGSFGSHTAWLKEPYASIPPSGSAPTGISYRDDDGLRDFFGAAQAAGLQVGVHAIGDAAIEQCIATWERVAEDAGIDTVRSRRHRIEHFECASDDHIRRAVELGLVGSVQPAFDHYWGGHDGLYAARMGPERALEMNRFKAMLDSGMTLMAGSDSTVTPLDPFLQMSSLRNHHVAAQNLDAATALALHSTGPLTTGGRADLALLDRDPLEVDANELTKTEVLGTWIGGRRVWPGSEAEAG
jgi:predicted amidohydrolase YtcJ